MLVIPVYNMLLLPEANLYFQLEELRKISGSKTIALNEKTIVILAKEKLDLKSLTEDSFYPIGVVGYISDIREGFVTVSLQYRINLENVFINPDHTIKLSISRRSEIEDLDESGKREKLKDLIAEMKKYASGFDWGKAADVYIDQVDSINMAICMMAPWLKLNNEERYELLKEDSVAKRTQMIEKIMYEFLEVGRITNEATSSQQKEYQQMYREQAIKRQMEHLQKELDDMHPENVSDVQKFEKKIAESGMNDTARKEAEKVLNRLRQEGQQSVESGILYDYLDFVTSLSWKKEEPRNIDLNKARAILDEDHYGLSKVKDRVIQQIAVMNLKKQQSGSILLFVGAPGTGKTSIGRSIARALGREYVRVSLGGVHDESDIRGHRRTYIGAMPGRIMDGIQKSGVSNPVMVLDEVDKLSASYNGSPASALLEVLDPEQNNTFTDHYMNVPYDLSDVLFICTANSVDTIPEPLLNRMEVIQFNGYTPIEKKQIALKHLVPKSMEAMGIREEQLIFTEEGIETLIDEYTGEAGVRGLRKQIDTLCRMMAVDVAKDPDTVYTVDKEKVRELLSGHPILRSQVLDDARPGVVTGLAWTPAGGEILYIETLLTKGKGELIITGQLGDVMKESALIALSLVKELFPEECEKLKDHDLHIHVPSGAVPKDGPSAGITLTTALASLFSGKKVDPQIAMTGEVALRGTVEPIGGLNEKLMAAQRAGVKKVFIPKDNVTDLKDVAEEVKEKLQITAVQNVTDVLKETGILPTAD
ncbi:MAG: endopeptidase La [Erysipelotrichaceae bacterium]|nr:endopeptidase La [Erysipelotrichaceae bacterium]